tara:strand:- start:54 stop:530 length:477 start_codon:yes stop_codon:yes gene_type:complete
LNEAKKLKKAFFRHTMSDVELNPLSMRIDELDKLLTSQSLDLEQTLHGMALLRFASDPGSHAHLSRRWEADSYTNYFFKDGVGGLGLIVPDLPELRAEASKLGLLDMVYFGHNTDPVEIIEPDQAYIFLMADRCMRNMDPTAVLLPTSIPPPPPSPLL